MFFSVVMPTYNRLEMLMRVLAALEKQKDAPEFEVIVINDGSSDPTENVASMHWDLPFTFRTQPNSGPSKARNHGVSLARGRFVVFIGDDTVPEPYFLAEHARTHAESDNSKWIACLGYTAWPRDERVTAFMRYINDYGLQFGYKLIRDGATVPFNFFYTSNISIDRELLVAYPFDTTFPAAAWEDIELAYRLDAQGLKITYNAKAVTRHYHRMTIDSFARRQYTVGKSGALFFSKHPELGHFLGAHDPTPLANDDELAKLTKRARWGERVSLLAKHDVFEKLMRQHYLRGLRDGMNDVHHV